MKWTLLKRAFKSAIVEVIRDAWTKETLKKCLNLAVNFADELAEGTENKVDDGVVSFLKGIVNDERKIDTLWRYLNPCKEYDFAGIEDLAVGLQDSDSRECEAIPWTRILKLVQYIVPILQALQTLLEDEE